MGFTVDFRALHEELGIHQQYSKWFIKTKARHGLMEGFHFENRASVRGHLRIFVTPEVEAMIRAVEQRASNAPVMAEKPAGQKLALATGVSAGIEPQLAPTDLGQLQIREYRGQRVVTLAEVDGVHGRTKGTAGRNFREHRDRFQEGKHYFLVGWDEIRRSGLSGVSDANRSDVVYLTEKGYTKLIKSFNDDLAWDVQEQLVETYFRPVQSGTLNLDDPAALRAALLGYSEQVIELKGQVQQLEHKVEEDAPKIKKWDNFLNSEGLCNRRKAAAALKVEERGLINWLVSIGHWTKGRGAKGKLKAQKATAKADALNAGYAVMTFDIDGFGVPHPAYHITPAGLDYYDDRIMRGDLDAYLRKGNARFDAVEDAA